MEKQVNKVTHLPENPDANYIWHLTPVPDQDEFYNERVNRNIGWLSEEDQLLLKNSTVSIAGCGGMGGLIAATLLRTGIGILRITDCENFDISNINRQFGAMKNSVGVSKVFQTARMLREIADDTDIIVYPQGINEHTAFDFVSGSDVVCDEIEFWALYSRILLHQQARKTETLLLNGNTIGHRTYLFSFDKNSFPIEKAIGFTIDEAKLLQDRIQNGIATPHEIQTMMNAIMQVLIPEIPEYSKYPDVYSFRSKVLERLNTTTTASIVGTNPPMAAGLLANQVLFHLLGKSTLTRNFKPIPSYPEWIGFDAGSFSTLKSE